MKRGKLGQQEIVGFVLIVVLVVVGLMMYLLWGIGRGGDVVESDIVVGNMISSIMHYTTSCSVSDERQTMQDLFANCQIGIGCENDNRPVCEVLQEEAQGVLEAVFITEGALNGVVLDFYVDDGAGVVGVQGFERVLVGNCTGSYSRAFEQEVARLQDVYVKVSVC